MFANRSIQQEDEKNQLNHLFSGLQKYSRFLVQNNWDADDLVQETLLKAIQNYHPSQVTSTLLSKIAYHHWIDTLRRRKHEVLDILEDVYNRDDGPHPDGLFDTVKLMMGRLTPKQAVIFTLKEAFNYQAKEIADMFDSTEMAIKSSLHRTKKRLEKEIPLQSVDSYWSEEDRELLSGLLYKSLQSEDPSILIDCISKIPALVKLPKVAKQNHSGSPLNPYCMAA